MLSCRDVANQCSDYLNKDLPLRTRLAIRLHLWMCMGCNRYYDQMRSTLRMLRKLGREETKVSADRAREIFRSSRNS
ncbi:MAG: zf-HC2 domain-containing protein [Acidobacteria bacterium]|nr:zf-HC2 domain-containing protein [Acidobacteriota bacterium]